MITIEEIQQLCKNDAIHWTGHIVMRLLERNIVSGDVLYALEHGEIIAQYPSDYPYPSCLVMGKLEKGAVLHIVCGIGAGELWLITAYYPDPARWSADFRIRKE
jgi:hypothetical protein